VNITGIEVIKRNPSVAAIGVVAGEKIELTYGDTLRVNVSFDYRGLAGTATLYGAIGNRGIFGFDEILHNEVSIDLPESLMDFTPVKRSVDIPITDDIDPGPDYDLYVKIKEHPEAGMPEVDDVIDIVGIPPEYELIQHTIYHFAYIYDGDVEVTTATFKTDPFTPSAWLGEKFASKLEEEVRARGGRPLEVKVYVDKTPLLWTDFRIEIISTPIGGVTEAAPGIAVGIPVWLAIILVCLAFVAVIVALTLAFTTVWDRIHPKPGLEEVKVAWKKEALILDIQDAEEYWERPPTPVETLEGMSEAELRDLLDQIAEEEVPTVPEEWLPLIMLGILGVGGLGAIAVAYALTKPTGD